MNWHWLKLRKNEYNSGYIGRPLLFVFVAIILAGGCATTQEAISDAIDANRELTDLANQELEIGRERGELGQERRELGQDRRELEQERRELGRERSELRRERSELERERAENLTRAATILDGSAILVELECTRETPTMHRCHFFY